MCYSKVSSVKCVRSNTHIKKDKTKDTQCIYLLFIYTLSQHLLSDY